MIRYGQRFLNWIAPSPPNVDDATAARIANQVWIHALHLLRVVLVVTPPSTALFAIVLWRHVDQTGLILWAILANVTGGLVFAASVSVSPHDAWRNRDQLVLCVAVGLNGASWGLVTHLAMPAELVWQAFTAVIVVSPLVVNAVFHAAVPRLFWAFHNSLALLAAAGFLMEGNEVGYAAAALILYAIPFGGMLARISRSAVIGAAYSTVEASKSRDELHRLNMRLRHDATHDALTGVANRSGFGQRLEAMLVNDSPNADDKNNGEAQIRRVGLLYLDLDHFKTINDTLGHTRGDQLLRAAAQRIQQVAIEGELVARVGGDEFVVLVHSEVIEEAAQLECLTLIGQRILNAFADPFDLDGHIRHVSVSIGAASGPVSARPEALMRVADAALYEAKRAGRSCLRTFSTWDRAHRWTEAPTANRPTQLQSQPVR